MSGSFGSPRALARLAGAMYIVTGGTALIGEMYVRGTLIVRGDPAATASNILANRTLWRAGGVADLVAASGDAILALLFFVLLAGVSRPLALLAAFFRLTHVAVLATTTLLHFAPLVYLSPVTPLKGLSTPALEALAFASLRTHAIGYNIALFFFGLTCITLGVLIARSGFLPRVIGVWLAIGGAAYVANSVVHLLAPAYGAQFFRYVLVPCALGELVLILWLLIAGLNEERWKDQLRTASSGMNPGTR
ncbi:MAG TPA: DUF4386 domain-containing protein [Thermoanaerobaculia bacterium]|nr:DUF4386 domain-containing protein [Thermoanaerobaculia bacterium]